MKKKGLKAGADAKTQARGRKKVKRADNERSRWASRGVRYIGRDGDTYMLCSGMVKVSEKPS